MLKKPKIILLVEDNPDDVELTRQAIRKNEIHNTIVVARDGAEALALLHHDDHDWEGASTPALILLDLKLPKIDGLEVLRRIRAHPRTRLLPVVILTSSGEDKDLSDCYEGGCNSYIRKPVDYDHFLEATRQLGLYWLALNQLPPLSAQAAS